MSVGNDGGYHRLPREDVRLMYRANSILSYLALGAALCFEPGDAGLIPCAPQSDPMRIPDLVAEISRSLDEPIVRHCSFSREGDAFSPSWAKRDSQLMQSIFELDQAFSEIAPPIESK